MPGSLRSSTHPARSRPLAALRGQPRESSSVWARGAVAGTALTVGAASLSFGVSSAIAAYALLGAAWLAHVAVEAPGRRAVLALADRAGLRSGAV